METLETTVSNAGFQNWLKGALALLFAKEGLHEFVCAEMTQFQKDVLASIFQRKPAATACNSCTTANVLACPTPNICSRGNCKIHDRNQLDKQPSKPCPQNVCNDIKNSIRNEHMYNKPSWKNTNATKWCTDAFEIAKCYMPPDGYLGISTLSDTDFNGTLSVIINNKRFKNKTTVQYKDISIKARDVGRTIRHSADLKVADSKLVEYIDILVDLLSDSQYLVTDLKAQEAVVKLRQLQSNTLLITTDDIIKALERTIAARQQEALQAIEAEKEGARKTIQDETKNASIQLLGEFKTYVSNLQTLTFSSLDQIFEAKRSTLDEIKKEGEKQKQDVAKAGAREREKFEESLDQIFEAKTSTLDEIKKEGEKQKQDVAKEGAREREKFKESVLYERQSLHREISTQISQKLEKSMKEDLIAFYRKYRSTIPVSPLVEENDVPLTDFYVKPPLTSIDVRRKYGKCRAERSIDSYKKLFFGSNDEKYKDIYITSKAGVGKSSFAKSVCMTWCQAYRPVKDKSKFNQEDIDVMKTFDFLFMISLRDIDYSVCDVDSMIERTLLNSLAGHSRYTRPFLEDLLNNRSCLILLDGLDEWSHPTSCGRGCHDVHSTPPHTPARNECTVMTTTRPWKFHALTLGTGQIDAHVDLRELDETLSKQLVSNAVSILNTQSTPDQQKTVQDFQTVTSTLKLGNIRYIPYILMQLICIWFDGKSVGKSICEIYSNIIELTITRGLQKLKKDALPRQNVARTYEIPSCLQSNDDCKSYYELLIGLGELAFKKLFSSKKEGNLVFQKSEVLDFISEDYLKFCLQTGLLTQEKVGGAVSERRSYLSFQHKLIQEYLAALYIQSSLDKSDTSEVIRKVCDSLPNVLQMSNVCICLAGFSPDACRKMFHIFENALATDKIILYFRENLITGQSFVPKYQEHWKLMKSLQGLKLDIVQEIVNSGQRKIPICLEDIIVDSTIHETECKMLMNIMTNKEVKVKSLSISECQTTEEFTAKLRILDMKHLLSLHKLMIDAVPGEQELQQLLLGSVNTLTCLYLAFTTFHGQLENSITTISSDTVRILTEMNNLQLISLDCISLKHADISLLFQNLTGRTSMRDVGLCNIVCEDHQDKCNGELLDLSQNKNLNELEVDTIPVSTLIVSSSSLKVCIIGRMRTDVLTSFLQGLPEANQLHTLSLDSLPEENIQTMMEEILRQMPQLRTLSLQQCFCLDNVYLPPVMTSLELVHLCDVLTTGSVLEKLIDSIDVLPQQVTLTLENIIVDDDRHYLDIKEKMRSKYTVISDGQNNSGEDLFSFQTCK